MPPPSGSTAARAAWLGSFVGLVCFGSALGSRRFSGVGFQPHQEKGRVSRFAFSGPRKKQKRSKGWTERPVCLFTPKPQGKEQRFAICLLFLGPEKSKKGIGIGLGQGLFPLFAKAWGWGKQLFASAGPRNKPKEERLGTGRLVSSFPPQRKRKKHQQRFGAGKQLFDSGHETSKLARSEVGKACSLFQTPPKSKMQRFETGKVCLRFSGLQKQARGSLCMDSTQCQCNFLLEERTFCPGNSPAIWPRPMLAL